MTFPWQVNFFNPPKYAHRLSFKGAVSSLAQFNLTNDSLVGLEIEYMYLEWPALLGLFNASLDVVNFANGGDPSSPTEFPDDIGWFNTVDDRTVPPKTTSLLEFTFGDNAVETGYFLIVRFTNGVELSVVV